MTYPQTAMRLAGMRNTLLSRVRLTATGIALFAFLAEYSAVGETAVVQVSPRDGATGVTVQMTVEIHFATGLQLATITPDSIRLLDREGRPVRARSNLGS